MDGLLKFANAGNERPRLQEAVFEIGPNGMGLDLLRAVYRNSFVELSTRMKAAAMCLPYESPKLGVTALVSESDLATVLDRRIKHLEEMRNGKLIEAKPTIDGEKVDARLQPRLPDRRFRRI